mmetsp:Transcript_41527/g.90011  ORF Transcript_41527/g.90011 Transcript_41527/m.90011 type:complete len:504 (+) Transcript_41527:1645-3156(+)
MFDGARNMYTLAYNGVYLNHLKLSGHFDDVTDRNGTMTSLDSTTNLQFVYADGVRVIREYAEATLQLHKVFSPIPGWEYMINLTDHTNDGRPLFTMGVGGLMTGSPPSTQFAITARSQFYGCNDDHGCSLMSDSVTTLNSEPQYWYRPGAISVSLLESPSAALAEPRINSSISLSFPQQPAWYGLELSSNTFWEGALQFALQAGYELSIRDGVFKFSFSETQVVTWAVQAHSDWVFDPSESTLQSSAGWYVGRQYGEGRHPLSAAEFSISFGHNPGSPTDQLELQFSESASGLAIDLSGSCSLTQDLASSFDLSASLPGGSTKSKVTLTWTAATREYEFALDDRADAHAPPRLGVVCSGQITGDSTAMDGVNLVSVSWRDQGMISKSSVDWHLENADEVLFTAVAAERDHSGQLRFNTTTLVRAAPNSRDLLGRWKQTFWINPDIVGSPWARGLADTGFSFDFDNTTSVNTFNVHNLIEIGNEEVFELDESATWNNQVSIGGC